MRPDGQPFTSLTGVMRRIRAFGFKKSVLDRRGILVYGITKKDLEKMNSYNYEPKEHHTNRTQK